MCTINEGREITRIYDKYRVEQPVDPNDIKVLNILFDADRVKYRFSDGKILVKSVVY